MKNRLLHTITLTLLFLTSVLHGGYNTGDVIKVNSKDGTFECQVKGFVQQNGYRIIHLVYPSGSSSKIPQTETIYAKLFLPDGIKPDDPKRPAVISLPILNGDENLNSLVCATLSKKGIISIMFTLPYQGERKPPVSQRQLELEPSLFISALNQTMDDITRTIDLLSNLPEVDKNKIGITGISLGGILSATVAGKEPRINRAAVLLAGGNLLKIIHHAKETSLLSSAIKNMPESERSKIIDKINEFDPLNYSSQLRKLASDNRLIMLNAAQDEVIPRECTLELAKAAGLEKSVIWFEGLGHYTAMAELPRALNIVADFFAKDLPPQLIPSQPSIKNPKPVELAVSTFQQLLTILTTEPEKDSCHFFKADLILTNNNKPIINTSVQLTVGPDGKFALLGKDLPNTGDAIGIGHSGSFPWFGNNRVIFSGKKPYYDNTNFLAYLDKQYILRIRAFVGAVGAIALVPDLASKWIKAEQEGENILKITEQSQRPGNDYIRIKFSKDWNYPEYAEFNINNSSGLLKIYAIRTNTMLPRDSFVPPQGNRILEVSAQDVNRMVAAVANFAGEFLFNNEAKKQSGTELKIEAQDPAGHGVLCSLGDKKILILDGTPEEIGAAHGALLKQQVAKLVERVLYGVGAVDSFRSGEWFIETMANIKTRTEQFIPKRFIEECYALADSASLPRRDVLYANLFPERFHCSGVAVRGKASADGKVYHARVLDYMRDIGLQNYAFVTVFIPEGKNAWMTLSYSGFIGTVTAMNEKGLAIGEMGGRGEGLWDGLPMSLLLREIMEKASNVEEALKIIQTTPRTCEYYYVISDKSGELRALHCLPDKITILKPGEQHPLLPPVPEDTVFVSGDERAKVLSERLRENFGKIDAQKMIEIIKRPVAMKSNLHNAIFCPNTLDMWFADAGKTTPACDEPYSRVNLAELIDFYKKLKTAAKN